MKKLLLGIVLLGSTATFAQLTEDFEGTVGGALPVGWTQVSAASDGGYASSTDLSSTYWPVAAHTTYVGTNDDNCDCDKSNEQLISAPFVVPASGVLSFEYALPGSYGETVTVGISTDGGATSTVITTLDGNGGAWGTGTASMGAYSGQTVNVVWTYDDAGAWAFGFMLDDITTFVPPSADMEMTSVDLAQVVVAGNVTIEGTVTSWGADNVTSIDITWDGGNSETFPVNLNYGDSYSFSHGTDLVAVAGTDYNFDVCVVLAGDVDANNDCVATATSAATQEGTRLPLMEVFTSSTCPPCYTLATTGFGGAGLGAYYGTSNANHATGATMAAISHQVNWPGAGDHAYNSEVASRVSFYGITGAPTVLVDAGSAGAPGDVTAAAAVPAYMDITATHSFNGNDITVNVDVDPYATWSGLTLQIALLDEGYAAGSDASFSNGETEFHHVFRKFLPAAGTSVNFTAGTPYSTSESYTMNTVGAGAYPAQGSFDHHYDTPREVVVFVQDGSTGDILNAAISTYSVGLEEGDLNNVSIYPNPATDALNVKFESNDEAVVSIMDLQGRVIETKNGVDAVSFSVANLAAGSYIVTIATDSNVYTENITVK